MSYPITVTQSTRETPNTNNPNNTRRRIQTLSGHGGKIRGGGRGSGWGGQGGRGRGSGNPNARYNDECQVTGINGKVIKLHPSYHFKQDQWFNLPEDVSNQLTQMEREYQSNKRQCTKITTTTRNKMELIMDVAINLVVTKFKSLRLDQSLMEEVWYTLCPLRWVLIWYQHLHLQLHLDIYQSTKSINYNNSKNMMTTLLK